MKKMAILICILILSLASSIEAAEPIQFENLNIASIAYGVPLHKKKPKAMAAYRNKIFFFLSDSRYHQPPSKLYCYNPAHGLSDSANHTIIAASDGLFTTVRVIDDLLYIADSNGKVYTYDGNTLSEIRGTPFSESEHVTSIEEHQGLLYFGTSISRIFRYNGLSYELVYEPSERRQPIIDMTSWEKDGRLYVSVGSYYDYCCPPAGYVIRSSTGELNSWEKVFDGFYNVLGFMATPDYLYAEVVDSAYGFYSSLRKSSDGKNFSKIHQSSNVYKHFFGSFFYDGIAYFFVDSHCETNPYGYRILSYNGLVEIIGNQGIKITQAVELNGEVYALAYPSVNCSDMGMATDVYLLTTSQGIVNHPPVVNAGENIAISSEEVATTTIQGVISDEDPDDDLECRWLTGSNVLVDWIPVGPNGECPINLTSTGLGVGTHTLILEGSDGTDTISDEVIVTIDNSAPHVAPTGGGTYEIYSNVVLAGQVSDYDGDDLSYEWSEAGEILFSGTVESIHGGDPVTLPEHFISDLSLGTHTLALSVSDGVNDAIVSNITVEIVDTTVPTLAPIPNKTILWPPNHEMVDIEIYANAEDNSGGLLTILATVTSNEPIDEDGDGSTEPDWSEPVIDQANGIIYVQLRAERSGSGGGRAYTVAITATDQSGNSSSADVEIIVPHDKGKGKK